MEQDLLSLRHLRASFLLHKAAVRKLSSTRSKNHKTQFSMAGMSDAEAIRIRNKKFTVVAFFEQCFAPNDSIPLETVAHNALCHDFKIEFLHRP